MWFTAKGELVIHSNLPFLRWKSEKEGVKCQKTNIFPSSADIKQKGSNIYSSVFSQSGLH